VGSKPTRVITLLHDDRLLDAGGRSGVLQPRPGLKLNEQEKKDLVAFMRVL
jgi:hypothetical protein